MKRALTCSILLLIPFMFAVPVYATGFDNQTVKVQWLYPNASTAVFSDNVLVGPGLELKYFGAVDIDLSPNQIVVSIPANSYFVSAEFNGFLFTDVNNTIDAITGVVINGSAIFQGLDASRITFDADNIWINLSNLPIDQLVHTAIFDVSFSNSVSEPASLLLLGLGLSGLGGLKRRFGKRY